MPARAFLRPDETALVIFTDGSNLTFGADGSGTSGEWEINPQRKVDRVILYRRLDSPERNEIYLANHAGTRPAPDPDRHFVDLAHVQYAGLTQEDWYEFAGKGQNPIRYVRGEG
jgi:hypothetical protein